VAVTTKKDLEALAETRLGDATHLFNGGRYSAAYYLAGYAVELAIKACIADHFQADTIPDKEFVKQIYTHDLNGLLGLAGIRQEFDRDKKNNRQLASNWGVASQWSETSRYAMWDQFAAASIIQAWVIRTMESCNG
jgi:HEPN domain-containing protein